MRPYSFLILIIFFINLFSKETSEKKIIKHSVLMFFVYFFTNRGYFLQTDFIRVEYWQATVFLGIILLFFTKRIKVLSWTLLVYSFVLFLNMFLLLLCPLDGARAIGTFGDYAEVIYGNLNYTLPVFSKFTFFFFFLALALAAFFDSRCFPYSNRSFKHIIGTLSFLVKIVLGICLIEFFFKNIFKIEGYYDVLNMFFGEGDDSLSDYIFRGTAYSLTGLTKEPSHLARSLTVSIAILFSNSIVNQKRRDYLWIIIAFALLIICGAFSSIIEILFLFVFFAVYFVGSRNTHLKRNNALWIVIILSFVFVVVSISSFGLLANNSDNYLYYRFKELDTFFENVINDRYIGTSSTSVRLFSAKDTLINLLNRPLMGIGLGTTNCYGMSALSLAEIGLLGVFLYFVCFFGNFMKDKRYSKYILIVLIVWFLKGFVSGITSRLIFSVDGIVFSMCLYLAISSKRNVIKQKTLI